MDDQNTTDHSHWAAGENEVSERPCSRSVVQELFWGAVAGVAIGAVVAIPGALLIHWLAHSNLQWRDPSCLIGLGKVLVSCVLGVMLLIILKPTIRKYLVPNGPRRRQPAVSVRSGVRLGSIIGMCLATATALYMWFRWIWIFRQSQMSFEPWHLVGGIAASIVYILAAGCLGALAVVGGLICGRTLQHLSSHRGSVRQYRKRFSAGKNGERCNAQEG